jgi:hypothetical protein
LDDEITRETMLCENGSITNERVKAAAGPAT